MSALQKSAPAQVAEKPSPSKRRKNRANLHELTMRRIERERKLSKDAPPVAPPDCPLLTLTQAGLVAGRRPNTLRKLIHEGKIGCYRDGIQIRIPMTELNRYMTTKLMYVPARAGV